MTGIKVLGKEPSVGRWSFVDLCKIVGRFLVFLVQYLSTTTHEAPIILVVLP